MRVLCVLIALTLFVSLAMGQTGSIKSAAPTVLFSDSFASGDFSKWSSIYKSSDLSVVADPTGQPGKVARIHYGICGDTANLLCGASHQDTNRYFAKKFNVNNGFPNGINHVFVKADVYFKRPQPGAAQNIQRKMLYFMAPSGPNGSPNHYYSVLLDTFAGSWSNNRPQLTITCDSVLLSGQLGCGSSKQVWSNFIFEYDRWYTVQYEVKVNTGDNPNGYVNVWVDGQLVATYQNMQLRPSSYTGGLANFQLGDQADRTNYLPVDEYRYWKNISFATGYQN